MKGGAYCAFFHDIRARRRRQPQTRTKQVRHPGPRERSEPRSHLSGRRMIRGGRLEATEPWQLEQTTANFG